MEFYGSIDLVSGSVTASVFSGSFQGDAAGLYGLQASGVTGLNLSQIANGSNTASISTQGFNVDTDTSITGSLKVSGTITAEKYNVTVVSSSVLYQSGSTKFGDSLDDTHDLTGSVNISGSITLNGEAIGTGKLNETTFNSYVTASDSKLGNIETSTGSLNSFTSSIDTTIKSKLDSENIVSGSVQVNITGNTGYFTFSSSISTSIGDVNSTLSNLSSSVATTTSNLSGSINTLSGSIATTTNNLSGSIDSLSGSVATTTNNLSSSVATTDLSQNNRLDTIESRYATTGSNTFKGTQTLSGSIIPSVDNTYDLGSTTYQWRDVYISSGSLYIDGTKVLSSTNQELTFTTDTGQSFKILESTTDNITLQTADGDIELKTSADGDILLDPTNGKITLKGPVEILNGNKIQSSIGGTPVVFANDIIVSGSIDLTGTIEGIDLTIFSSSINTRVGNTETSVSSLNSLTSSVVSRIESLETESGSVRTTLNSYTSSANSRLSSIETTTGSIITINTTQDGRLTSIENKTGSYATTGSNVFLGNQIITGSLYISQNLVVQGSSSIEYVTSSQLRVDDNVITLNTSTPGQRFGGIEVYDSGSANNATGSILWDSLNNRWIYQNSNDAGYGGGMFLSGPRSSGSLGSELTLTSGKIAKSAGGDHLNDSIINESGGGIGIGGNLVITGSIVASTTSLVSGSSQISFNGITDKPTLVSGSSQITFSGISGLPTLVSGSSQIDFTGITSKPTLVSGSSQILFTGLSSVPGGLVSGSSQIDLTATTNYASGIKTRLDAVGVISGSAQITLDSASGTLSVTKGGTGATTAAGVRTNLGLVIGTDVLAYRTFGTAAASATGDFATATQGTTADNALPKAGGALTGPLSITGNGTYLGDWGYGTLTLNDTGGYPGILFRNSGNIWMLRRNGADNGFDFAYSTNATGQGTGTFTQQGKWVAGGDLYVRGQIYVGGNGSSTGTQLVYNSGTWSISINGNAATATTATTAGALSSMNISQFTNNSGYITGINSSAVTTALGYTPYNSTNPSGYIGINNQTYFGINNTSNSSGNGISLYGAYSGGEMNYGIMFAGTPTFGTHGSVTGDWATYFMMNPDNTRGWIFRKAGSANVASISGGGNASFTGTISASNFSGSSSGTNTGDQTNISGTAASETLSTVTNRGSSTSQNIVFSNGRKGLVGVYDAAQTQAIFAMGIDYILTNGAGSGTIGNHYGLAWSYNPDYGGAGNNPQSKAGLNHQLLHMQAGVTTTAIGSGIWTSGGITCGTVLPLSNNSYNLGSTGTRWANIYTNDLHLSNEGKEGGNEIDGTTGDWTIQEGEENLYIINHKNGKKFKIDLTEIV